MPKKQTEPKTTITVEAQLSGRKLGIVGATVELPIEDLNLGTRVTIDDLAKAVRATIVDGVELEGKATFKMTSLVDDDAEPIEYALDPKHKDHAILHRDARDTLNALISKVKVTNGREALAELKALRAAVEATDAVD